MHRAYRLGVLLRNSYRDLLSKEYKAEEVYAQSTDVTRTKDTSKLVLAGVAGLDAPPIDDLNKYLEITGPNHISEQRIDTLFNLDKCRRYNILFVSYIVTELHKIFLKFF